MADLVLSQQRIQRFSDLILHYRWIVLALSIVVVVLAAAGGRNLTISNDSRIFFGEDNPQRVALEELENTFTETNNVMITVTSKSDTIFNRDALMAMAELTDGGWQIPYSNRVDSLTNYAHSWSREDDLIVEDLVPDASAVTEADLARIEAIALNEIALTNRLVAADGNTAAVNINFVLPEASDPVVNEIMDAVTAMLDQAKANHPELEFHMTGGVVTSKAFGEAAFNDVSQLGPIIILVIAVSMALLLRSIIGTVSVLIVVIFSALTAMGIAGWAGFVLSPGSVGAPTIIMTVAIAHSVHVITTMVQSMRSGMTRRDAIAEALRINVHPVFLTTVTTAIGFLSMNFSDSPPFHALGNLVAIGVVSAFVYSMTFLPAFLSVMPVRVKPVPSSHRPFFDRFGEFVVNRRKPLLWGMVAVVIALAAGIPQINLNDNWTTYFDERYEFRRDTDYIIEHLTGVEAFEYVLDAGEEGGITEPAYLAKLDEFADWYRTQDKIVHVWSFADVMKRLNKNMHGDDEAYYRVPEERDLAAQYLLLYELSLPFGRDLNDQIDIAKSSTRMVAIGRNMTAKDQRALDDKAYAWLQENTPEGMGAPASGLSMMFAYISKRNIDGMLKGTIIAMALISGILILALRSVRIGLISLIPNFVPAAMGFGLWGYLIGNVGVAASVVTAVTFGIVVDDTIHFLSKYLRARRERGLSSEDAVKYSFSTVGHALWTTTAVIAAGFVVLATSGFEVNWSMGLLTAITIVLALIADFLFLPPLLMQIDRRQR